MKEPSKSFLAAATEKKTLTRAVKVSVLVGTILIVINQVSGIHDVMD